MSRPTPVVPPIPRRRRVLGVPQAITLQSCPELGVFVVNAILPWLFFCVLLIPPSQSGLDLLQADIPIANTDSADPALVAVDLPAVYCFGATSISAISLSSYDKFCRGKKRTKNTTNQARRGNGMSPVPSLMPSGHSRAIRFRGQSATRPVMQPLPQPGRWRRRSR